MVIVDCSSSSSRTVHCVGRAGTVCFGGGVVSCGEEGVSVPILVVFESVNDGDDDDVSSTS